MKVLTNNLLGRVFPFFISNKTLGNSYFIYQLVSPKVSKNCIPFVSLKKISERIPNDGGSDRGDDLITLASGINQPDKNKAKVENWFRKGFNYFPEVFEQEGTDFPMFEMDPLSQSTQRSLVVLLRDAVRWNRHRFFDGRLEDVLVDPEHFVTMRISNKDGMISLKPENMYHVLDCNLKNPMPIDLSLNFGDVLQPGKDIGAGHCSTICQAIKKFEMGSFDRGKRKDKTLQTEETEK